jgi:hypothetical protein
MEQNGSWIVRPIGAEYCSQCRYSSRLPCALSASVPKTPGYSAYPSLKFCRASFEMRSCCSCSPSLAAAVCRQPLRRNRRLVATLDRLRYQRRARVPLADPAALCAGEPVCRGDRSRRPAAADLDAPRAFTAGEWELMGAMPTDSNGPTGGQRRPPSCAFCSTSATPSFCALATT